METFGRRAAEGLVASALAACVLDGHKMKSRSQLTARGIGREAVQGLEDILELAC